MFLPDKKPMKLLNDNPPAGGYKALILDVDGTTIPNRQDGMPSEKVTQAIKKASEKLHVGLASGRPYNALTHITKHLKLKGPIIVNGGARVMDAGTHQVLWEQPLDKNDAIKIGELLLHELKLPCFINDDGKDIFFSDEYIPKVPLEMCVQNIDIKIAEDIEKKLHKVPTVVCHIVHSWTKGNVDILINHAAATKQHGVFELAKILKIDTHEIIGVGDSGNDFPLLMACGLKVAMGNARDELKAIADYVAPSVTDDGVADVIEKFIL